VPQRPLALTDAQLDSVMAAAAPLRPADRDAFLILIASRLRDVGVIGDGVVARVAREVQASFWAPHADEIRVGSGKYR
jgi:hypothetical protein